MFSYFKRSTSQSKEKQNVMSAFRPMYIILTVFGLLPYSLRFPKGKVGATVIRKSIYFNCLCSVSIIIIIYSSFFLHVQQVFSSTESDTMTEVITTKMNYLLELATFVIFTTVSYFCAFKNRHAYVKILNTIVSTFNKFPDHCSAVSLCEIEAHVKFIAGSTSMLLVVQLIVNFTREGTVWKMVLVLLSFILPQMIQFTVIHFYYILVFMVVALLKNIHEQIVNIAKARKFNATDFMKVEIRTVDLSQMEIVFVKMLETKREINKVFQASILATTMQCFHSAVSEAHIIYHGLVIEKTLTTHDIFNCSIWIGYQVIKIYIISCSGNILKKQVVEIGRSIHNIPTGKDGAKLYLEIQHFSTLILCQNAELTVYDYFPLNANLMFNIVTSAVMYLVIFVQFDRRP